MNKDVGKLQQLVCLLMKQVRELSLRLKTEEERDLCKVNIYSSYFYNISRYAMRNKLMWHF